MANKSIYIVAVLLMLNIGFTPTEGSNILAILPTFSPSHLIIEMAVVRTMAERNHNVTVVSLLPLKEEWLDSSMTYIKLDTVDLKMDEAIRATQGKGLQRIPKIIGMLQNVIAEIGKSLDDPKLRELLDNPGNNFDLMLFGYIFSDYFFGLAEHFNCPVALIWPNIPIAPLMQSIGNPMGIEYATVTMLNPVVGDTGFLFRIKNLGAVCLELISLKVQESLMKDIYGKYFPADKYASFEKAKERVAMVLFSHHFTEKPVRPLVPALIEIGGIHLNEQPKSLPEDIEAFVNSAEHGVIFFSLGTNVKSNHLQEKALDKIYNVLSKLPQKILWKCDDESNVPGNSSNVLFRKWLPQADILAHQNVKLFFGHGGKGGITEAKFYGVPMVGLPVFGDQPMNMEEVVSKGYGLSLNHDLPLTEEIIYNTLKEVLENATYAQNVKTFSTLYRDRPMSIKDNAVYWLEYLIRHKGAPHLQSPLKTMSFIEKNNLDVIVVILTVLYLILQCIKLSTKFVIKLLCRSSKKKSKHD